MTAAVAKRQGIRKPVQLELIGGKPPRQRVWEQIRKNKLQFSGRDMAHRAGVDSDTAQTYIHSLEAGGYVVRLTKAQGGKADYQLIRDTGIEAPRLTKDGKPVTQGLGQEAMWRCLRMLGPLDYRQLAMHATSSGVEVRDNTAKRYVAALKKAGYLQVVQPAGRQKGKVEIFQLIPRMNTGPRPPQIQRVGVVYDPNLNKVMHADEPEELL